ncbi:hypothetical protein JCM14244_01580 [Venenivibrio stagnispumantis]|uniref:Uncharacterized protein n=1 Tax=Venenivibrio stagnispumantis TaxID=407998 RepID=A0AA45WKJ3_9AQUI|nr:hypothetical protein [Venenivibrio stagnispumantis]MCW4573363.1 hypothetical protein [Venenivibrio stagnispumantis]SMP06872.1 hypothetical protein SAMN06264868_104101 [Venenivibrio stagnispumantis]
MKKLEIFFNSLEQNEKRTIFIAVLIFILFIGIFFIYEQYKKIKAIETKITKEIANYNEVLELASIYSSKKGNLKSLNLSDIDKISQISGIKSKVSSIKPINYEGKELFEINLENITPVELETFINNLQKENINIYAITIDNIRQNNNLKISVIAGA